MNLSVRQSFGQNIFTQSMAEMNYRKSRILASTGASNLNNSMYTTRLPQLSRSFSSSKSTKLKLTTIEGTLSALTQQLQELRLDTRESRRHCNFLKDDLAENTLNMLKLDLMTTVKKFDKTFKLSKKHDEDRSRALQMDCDKLRESSAHLQSLASRIQSKLDTLEGVMGLYSGKQRHKL